MTWQALSPLLHDTPGGPPVAMIENPNGAAAERLTFASQLSDLAKLPAWIDTIASRYAIPEKTRFAMNLCLEEALSNIIQHGHRGASDSKIEVQFRNRAEGFYFTIEDTAPPFDPVNSPELPAIHSFDDSRVGGQGIRLLRRFADSLEYLATPEGNRLVIGFSAANQTENKTE